MELLASILVAVVVVELYAWLPKISECLCELAVSVVHAEDRERCREEWKAQLDSLPNTIARAVHALSLLGAARQINAEFYEDKLNALGMRLENVADIHRCHRGGIEDVRFKISNLRKNRKALMDTAEANLKMSLVELSDSGKSHAKIQKPLMGHL